MVVAGSSQNAALVSTPMLSTEAASRIWFTCMPRPSVPTQLLMDYSAQSEAGFREYSALVRRMAASVSDGRFQDAFAAVAVELPLEDRLPGSRGAR